MTTQNKLVEEVRELLEYASIFRCGSEDFNSTLYLDGPTGNFAWEMHKCYRDLFAKAPTLLAELANSLEAEINLKEKQNEATRIVVKERDRLIAERDSKLSAAERALEIAYNRDLDWDMMHTKSSNALLQDWRGKCFEALKEIRK